MFISCWEDTIPKSSRTSESVLDSGWIVDLLDQGMKCLRELKGHNAGCTLFVTPDVSSVCWRAASLSSEGHTVRNPLGFRLREVTADYCRSADPCSENGDGDDL